MSTVADVFTNLSSVVTGVTGQLTTWVTTISSVPVLTVAFLLPLVGVGIGLLKRLLSTHM